MRYDSRRVAVEVVAVSLVLGVVVGWLATVVGPEVVGVVDPESGDNYQVGIVEAGGIFPTEATFAALAAVAGAVLSIYYVVRFRMRPVTTLCALVGGGAAGTAVAFLVARLLGPGDAAAQAAEAAAGATVELPLTLHAPGVLAAWPLAAALVVFAAALVRDDRTPWNPGSQSRAIGARNADVS